MSHRLVAAALAAVLLAGAGGYASACTLDGKPSAFANGVRAVTYTKAPTPATYAWWARFAFPVAFHTGQQITFREDDAQVRKVLPSLADLHRSWRWRFGEGKPVIGDQASHVYRHAGRFRVSADAYFPGYGWQAFDTITITVRG